MACREIYHWSKMMAVLVLLMAGLVSSSVTCPDGSQCQDRTTCCPTKTGYGCCIYPNAVCCSDKAHCCPQDYQCNPQTMHCEKKELPWYSFPMSPQIAAEETDEKPSSPAVEVSSPSVSVVHCDNHVVCPDGTTCCRSPYGQWSCCRFSIGQCCPDGFHCCPYGYHCDSTSTHCFRGALSLPASQQLPAMLISTMQIAAEETDEKPSSPAVEVSSPSVSVVHCDNHVVCPDGTTCCRSPYGQWSCCRFNIGQCCPDGFHCCPYGYHCDSTSTHCFRGALSLPASQQLPAMLISTKQDLCCLSELGCCPLGFHCDEESRACVGDSGQAAPVVPLMQAVESQVQNEVQAAVIRCNTRFYCPAGHSCCKAPTGQWGCCPYPLGQCCKDGKHCCEYGYDCDSTFSTCQKGKTSFPARPKKNALFL